MVLEVDDRTLGIWLYDATRDTLSPLAVEGRNAGPILTPDGRDVIYVSIRNGSEGLWMRRVDGSGDEENLTATTTSQIPNSISPDGKSVVFGTRGATRSVLLKLNLTGSHKPEPVLPGPGNRAAAAFSPDGRWIAYVSDESGENEVYVAAASEQGGKWQISSGGGAEPVWARDGRELFFRAGNKMMAFGVSAEEPFSTGRAVELFEGDFEHGRGSIADLTPDYDISPDGRRFLMIQPTGAGTAAAPAKGLHVVLNWFDDLQHRLAQGRQQ
jgi:Tol biopolymer transport system component